MSGQGELTRLGLRPGTTLCSHRLDGREGIMRHLHKFLHDTPDQFASVFQL